MFEELLQTWIHEEQDDVTQLVLQNLVRMQMLNLCSEIEIKTCYNTS